MIDILDKKNNAFHDKIGSTVVQTTRWIDSEGYQHSKTTVIPSMKGAVKGVVVGAIVAGPVGAVIGGAIGGVFGEAD